MSSIVVYQTILNGTPIGSEPDQRRAGMRHVGGLLRDALKGVDKDKEVKAAVNAVLEAVMPEATTSTAMEANSTEQPADPDDEKVMPVNEFKTLLESKGDGTSREYILRKRENDANGKNPKFMMVNKDGTSTNNKLKIDGKVDDFDSARKMYQMTSVSPEKPADIDWIYLSGKVYGDLKAIEAEAGTNERDIENYLIATFAFTRCR